MIGIPPTSPPLAAPASAGHAPAASAAQTESAAQTTNVTAAGAAANPAQTAVSALQNLLAAARLSAAVKQDGMAVLMANVLRAAASGTLPQSLQAAVQQLADLHLSTDKAPDAAALKAALEKSGLFTESELAKGNTPADLKTALGQLYTAAQAQRGGTAQTQQPAAGPNVAPPVPGAPPAAQSPAASSLPKEATAELVSKLLAEGSEAALARQALLQMASLPDTAKPGEVRYVFDLPLMTPQGAAVAQLIVQRDAPEQTGSETPEPVWRVGLAVDVEPLGPVRAQIALGGSHAWVRMTADRMTSLDKLQKESGWLASALTEQALEADIGFPSGTAAQQSALPRLVDRQS